MLQPNESAAVGGLQPLVDIINRADRTTERLILEGLEQRSDPELAEEVRRRMFMFEDIVQLEDRAVQLVLRQVETKDLAVALKGVSDEVRDKVVAQHVGAGRPRTSSRRSTCSAPSGSSRSRRRRPTSSGQIRALEESGQIVISRGCER